LHTGQVTLDERLVMAAVKADIQPHSRDLNVPLSDFTLQLLALCHNEIVDL
jgi:hypothetical protein